MHKTEKGYIREYHEGKLRMQHVIVWEQHNGPIPPGMQIHHRNHIKDDNRIKNLQLVTPTEHKRIHSGCKLKNGVWWKPCKHCTKTKPITTDHWYIKNDQPLYGKCKPCHIQKVRESKKN
jgi:hypothetical protein